MAWDNIARAKHRREMDRYPSDLSDAEWVVVVALLPGPRPGGRPRTTKLRDVMEAILYMASSGCQWRMLPKDRRHGDRANDDGFSPHCRCVGRRRFVCGVGPGRCLYRGNDALSARRPVDAWNRGASRRCTCCGAHPRVTGRWRGRRHWCCRRRSRSGASSRMVWRSCGRGRYCGHRCGWRCS